MNGYFIIAYRVCVCVCPSAYISDSDWPIINLSVSTHSARLFDKSCIARAAGGAVIMHWQTVRRWRPNVIHHKHVTNTSEKEGGGLSPLVLKVGGPIPPIPPAPTPMTISATARRYRPQQKNHIGHTEINIGHNHIGQNHIGHKRYRPQNIGYIGRVYLA